MTRVKILAGACGFSSVLKIEKIDKMTVKVEIITACQDLQALNEDFNRIDCSRDVFGPMVDSLIYKLVSRKVRHTDCPIPVAIIKGIQIELGGAIAKDVVMKFDKLVE